ncbi:MAG: BrnT family toxin [Calditrichaeota bacterium]|nr:BrnT family toxin [Calditrichota bacterium]
MTANTIDTERLDFDWDDAKAEANLCKHGISFAEAESVFDDPLSAVFNDPDHSIQEARKIIKGHSEQGRLLLVCFVVRGDTLRIISARRLTKPETKEYEEGKRHRRRHNA